MKTHEIEPDVPIAGIISREGELVSISLFGGHTIEVKYLDGLRVMREGFLNDTVMDWEPWEVLGDV